MSNCISDTQGTEPMLLGGGTASALVGVWTLAEYTDVQEGAIPVHPFGTKPEGLLIYTREGFVSAQLMKPGRPALGLDNWRHGSAESYAQIASGYIAYCGRYAVDEAQALVVHRPIVALFPGLIARDQQRHYELSGERLILSTNHTSSDGVMTTTRLVWIRHKDS